MDVEEVFSKAIDRKVVVINDGDAAGLAEVRYGAGAGVKGKVVVVTLGTGVGTSLFLDGRLIPNMELGRLQVRGKPAGERAATGTAVFENSASSVGALARGPWGSSLLGRGAACLGFIRPRRSALPCACRAAGARRASGS
jgi:predicted NBD/HSP70 family sugar kinase